MRWLASLMLLCMAPAAMAKAEQVIPDQYIVVLKKPSLGDEQSIPQSLDTLLNKLPLDGVSILKKYDTALLGFAAKMPAHVAQNLAQHGMVAYVEPDSLLQLNNIQNGASWGLDRIDSRPLVFDMQYRYQFAGEGVHAYVLDSGINAQHQDFGNRVGNGFDATSQSFLGGGGGLLGGGGIFGGGLFGSSPEPAPDNSPTQDPFDSRSAPSDCNGHGTHVAATLGGTRHGVAKQVTVHAVRVVNCLGFGSGSDTLDGIEWVMENHVAPAVMNLSLGGTTSQALDDSIRAALQAGIVTVVAAGNETQDACRVSPAREPTAITVAATDRSDNRASYSNFGRCVDIFAPGSEIESASHSNNTASTVMSGTSMASPHVAGAVAKLLSEGIEPKNIAVELSNRATNGSVLMPNNSPNRLLFSN